MCALGGRPRGHLHSARRAGRTGIAVRFDEEPPVADAGIVLAATLAQRLVIEALVDETADFNDRPGAADAGAKVMTDAVRRRNRELAFSPPQVAAAALAALARLVHAAELRRPPCLAAADAVAEVDEDPPLAGELGRGA